MAKRIHGWSVRIITLLAVLAALAPAAQAAGEWEWTAGQGWIRGAGVARPTPKEQLHYAYELEQKSEFMDAARQYFLLVQNFPASEEAGVGLQRLARCLFEMENYYTSYQAIEQVIETYPNTGRMSDLVEIELRIAKKLMVSQTPDILSGREENTRDFNIRRGLEIIASVIEHDPYGPVAAEAYLAQGEGHLFLNEVQAARKSFETIRDEFPRSELIERARLGILQCDSILGNARPQELAEQMDVVREAERERLEGREELDEMDDVENTFRQFNEIEAAKLMEQAEQYRRMGTRKSVQSSEFLFKEIVRRYPGSPQAEDAMARLGNLNIPREQSRITKVIKNININPFSYNRDREPEWIVPQLDSEDMVMVDNGLGPIAGVPETGVPQTSYSATVRPASLKDQPEPANFSPASAAPEFIDGVAGQRTYTSSPNQAGPAQPGGMGMGPGFGPPQRRMPGALSHAPDADLVLPPGSVSRSFGGGIYGGTATVGMPSGYGQGYANTPNPSLGNVVDNTPYSDLVGPMADNYAGSGYAPAPAYGAPVYGAPPAYGTPAYGGRYGAGQPPAAPPPPRSSGGGWTFGDDLR